MFVPPWNAALFFGVYVLYIFFVLFHCDSLAIFLPDIWPGQERRLGWLGECFGGVASGRFSSSEKPTRAPSPVLLPRPPDPFNHPSSLASLAFVLSHLTFWHAEWRIEVAARHFEAQSIGGARLRHAEKIYYMFK